MSRPKGEQRGGGGTVCEWVRVMIDDSGRWRMELMSRRGTSCQPLESRLVGSQGLTVSN